MSQPATSQRTAVVIGASSGMGMASAIGLHADGYSLKLADLSLPSLQDVGKRLGAETFAADVTSESAIAALALQCRDGVDALVITAGLSMSMAPFERIMDVNLGGTARVLRHFGPLMRPGGAAVCMASIAGHLIGSIDAGVAGALTDTTTPDLGRRVLNALPVEMRIPGMAYGLSKLGVMKLVQRAAVEWGAFGARVCSISPGLIDTPMGALERKTSPEADIAVPLAPIPRTGTAAEVANVVAFLCSPQASYMTACDVLVDGGWVGAIHSGGADSPFARALAASRQKS